MSNTLYDNARYLFATGKIDWENDDFKVMLVSSSYTPETSTHTSLADVSSSARMNTAQSLSNMSADAGACDAEDVTFSSVDESVDVEYIIIYKYDSSSESLCYLIAIIDTATGLPITPNGGDIIVTWDSGTNKIFRL